MTQLGRAALAKILASAPYKLWAAANTIEAAKVAQEYVGVRKPTCSSRYGQGLQTLCRENPPAGVPIPPPVPATAVAPIFRKDAVMMAGSLSNFAGETRATALSLGWTVIDVQLTHTQYAHANELELATDGFVPWIKTGWGTYGQGSDPHQDGLDAAAIVKRLGLVAWKANGEAWAENEGYGKTSAFLRGWVEGGTPCPLGWSVLSSDTANYARAYDYPTALSVSGADIDIQVYGATNRGYTVGAGLGMLAKAQVPQARTTMTFDFTGDGTGPFADYNTWTGPRRVWTDGNVRPETFQQLARP